MTERLTLVVDSPDISRGNRVWAEAFAEGRRSIRTKEARHHKRHGNIQEAERQREERDRIR